MHQPSQRPDLLQILLVPSPPCLRLYLRGELDLCSAVEMPRDSWSTRPDLTKVLVDLRELTFCDAAGLNALLTFSRIHEAQGRSVDVVRATPFVRRVMRLCGMTDRLAPVAPVAGSALV
jgi:anti-anti-sigma factor